MPLYMIQALKSIDGYLALCGAALDCLEQANKRAKELLTVAA